MFAVVPLGPAPPRKPIAPTDPLSRAAAYDGNERGREPPPAASTLTRHPSVLSERCATPNAPGGTRNYHRSRFWSLADREHGVNAAARGQATRAPVWARRSGARALSGLAGSQRLSGQTAPTPSVPSDLKQVGRAVARAESDVVSG
jgi:hypothetical protein